MWKKLKQFLQMLPRKVVCLVSSEQGFQVFYMHETYLQLEKIPTKK